MICTHLHLASFAHILLVRFIPVVYCYRFFISLIYVIPLREDNKIYLSILLVGVCVVFTLGLLRIMLWTLCCIYLLEDICMLISIRCIIKSRILSQRCMYFNINRYCQIVY